MVRNLFDIVTIDRYLTKASRRIIKALKYLPGVVIGFGLVGLYCFAMHMKDEAIIDKAIARGDLVKAGIYVPQMGELYYDRRGALIPREIFLKNQHDADHAKNRH